MMRARLSAVFASIGVCVLCGWTLSSVAATASTVSSQHRHTAVGALLAVVVAACVWRCQVRNAEWADADSLYAAALQVCPESARINNNVGTRYEAGTDGAVGGVASVQGMGGLTSPAASLRRICCVDAGCFAVGRQQLHCRSSIPRYRRCRSSHWRCTIGDQLPPLYWSTTLSRALRLVALPVGGVRSGLASYMQGDKEDAVRW